MGSSHFQRSDSVVSDTEYVPTPCAWRGCYEPKYLGLPVCFEHAVVISGVVRRAAFGPEPEPDDVPERAAYVYYLMVGPTTVKIGTTTNLRNRIAQLRSELQYVVAIEPGGFPTERQRHQQFAAERFGRREDFHLTDRLKRHIEALQPRRDELVTEAS
jgi:hypothetical protein